MSKPSFAERMAGGVWGHLVGDAVGVPYEFTPPRDAASVVFGHTGTYHQPPGTWSDDGALMLALLDSLLSVGFDTTDQAKRALAWRDEGAFTPDNDGHFDIGLTTADALSRIASGTPAETAGGTNEHASGNGSLMRILPIALVERDADDATLVDHAQRASRVTHGTAHAQVACALYVLIARRLFGGSDYRLATLADASQTLRGIYQGQDATDLIAALDHLETYAERGGGGVVWDSFWSAWDAFNGGDDYRSTIQRAVAYGGDTDTTAAIAGGLAGIHWGIEGIPADWLAGMRGKGIVTRLIDRLLGRPATPDPTGASVVMSIRRQPDRRRPVINADLRVDEVDLKKVPGLRDVPGRLGMTILPGRKGYGSHGLHDRDLRADAVALRSLGVDRFVLLVEDQELRDCEVPDIVEVLASNDVVVRRFPIVDGFTPSDQAGFAALMDEIEDDLQRGRFVAVTCRAGLGRTGTLVGCLLRQNELDGEAAIALTRASRGGTIEPYQVAFVQGWARQPRDRSSE